MAKKKTKKQAPRKYSGKAATKLDLKGPLYFIVLRGPETYLLSEYVKSIRETLEAKHGGEIETYRYDGASDEPADILDEARSYSLMQTYKIVLVDNANELVSNENNRNILMRYLESPSETATIILRASKWLSGNPTNFDKMAAELGQVVKCEQPTADRAAVFVQKRAEKRYDCTIEPTAARQLVDLIGPSLSRLDAEISRLAVMAEPGQPIDTDLITEHTGISREQQVWSLQSILLRAKPADAVLEVLELLEVSRQPPTLISYCVLDLIKKIRAANELSRSGLSSQEVASKLKIWGESKSLILKAAERINTENLNALMKDAVSLDVRNKSGYGVDTRGVELLTLRFVHELNPLNR